MQTMAEWDIRVGIVAEPYLVPPNGSSWVGDDDGSVAIVINRDNTEVPPTPFMATGRGSGFVAANWGELVIIGVYFSPNRNLIAFERFLDL